MKTVWKLVDSLKVKRAWKRRIYIGIQMLFYAAIGAILWAVLGKLLLPQIEWLFCFIGYPAVFVGLFGSVLYLYKHEFA